MNDDSPSHFPATAPYEAPPEYWAIAPGGLYRIGGSDDDGAPIAEEGAQRHRAADQGMKDCLLHRAATGIEADEQVDVALRGERGRLR